MIHGILFTHGTLGEAFLRTARRIVGETEGVWSLSSSSKSPGTLAEELEEMVTAADKKKETVFIFVGLKGGNPWHVARRVAKKFEGTVVIAGLNLPMLLSFLTKREAHPAAELADILRNDAIRGIDVWGDA
jgi:PTS system mannose-specific IIA component